MTKTTLTTEFGNINFMESMPDIPSANNVDYTNVAEICGYQRFLCKMFETGGGLNYPATSNRLTAAVKREGKIWLSEVKKSIADLFASPITAEHTGFGLESIPSILEAYDFFHRICNGTACHEFIRDIVLKSADRYIKGDKSISIAQVALMLLKEMDRDIRTIEERYLTFSMRVMKDWIVDLERIGKIRQVSESDSYDILRFLLFSDLLAFGIKRDDKLKWIKRYALTDEELNLLDTNTLLQYIGFNRAADFVAGKSIDEKDARYVYLFSRVAEREDIHQFFRDGLAIDLAKYRTA